jgi:hypothetical protein
MKNPQKLYTFLRSAPCDTICVLDLFIFALFVDIQIIHDKP